MAISKVKLPNNTTQDIHDSRIAAIDSAPASGSTNVVTSGGVYTAIENAGGGIENVAVTVGPNSGTPTGSATLTDGTLSLSFDNLKGSDGPAGASSVMSKVTYTSSDTSVSGLAWDTVHVFPEMSTLTISSLASVPSDSYEHELAIVFDSSSSGITLSFPSTVYWGNNRKLASNASASKRYEVRISSSSMIALYTEVTLQSS